MQSIFTLRRLPLFAVLITIIWLAACTRVTSTELGSGLIPPIDGVVTKDTLLDVMTDSFDDADTARVYAADQHVVGAITNDPLFGRTTASMYFEMQPALYPFSVPGTRDSIVVDSAVLILSYKGVYGDSTQPIRLTLSEVDHNTPIQPSAYPSNYPNVRPLNVSGQLAPPVTIDIRRLKDSVKNRYENAVNQLRIKVRSDVAARFIKFYDSTNAYKSDSVLREYFAGFALTADATSPANALLQFNLTDTNSKFALYYSSSTTGATTRDTNVVNFRFTAGVSRSANFVTRNRAGSEISNHLTTTAKPDSLVYVQTGPGTYVRVRIPGLKDLSNRIIHRAELIAEQVPDDANLTTIEAAMLPPRYLLLSVWDSVNQRKRNVPNDYIISSDGPNISSFGGFLTYKSINGYDRVGSYVFDLTRYAQGVITRKDTTHTLRLTAPVNDSIYYTPPYPTTPTTTLNYLNPSVGNDIANGRVRLGGGTHSRFRMRLRIIFSRI
ncbi:DUF4270 family protein [Sediminibacterium ginsengisoli]|uniref:DUF4270 domain-containing protein n=1 Tax=Sediminibacterium ginsengisoli TaxID=413434 RepID=A0A1T4L7P4_9BACT|nr:DUF4270 family protein [Sediminibacterium ginsengisoli]SJZ50735.1 protein of unknown function [Sediminibacterium ginsengisoli]